MAGGRGGRSCLDRTDVHGASGTRRSLHGAAGAKNLVFLLDLWASDVGVVNMGMKTNSV